MTLKDAHGDGNIWDKFEAMVESINPYINGPNSWTNGRFKLDYTPAQYKKLKNNVVPTLEDLKQNKNPNVGPVKSDKSNLIGILRAASS